VSNRVVTSKYNVITFLPIFLFEMFSRVAYLYFLAQVLVIRGLLGWAGLGWARNASNCTHHTCASMHTA
jgi:hypothetical protein